MSVITNMVVALMIVTQGEEPVKAIPCCDDPQTNGVWVWNAIVGETETLYRKTCKTNFVYSTTVPIRPLYCQCDEFGCSEMHHCTFEELLGRRVSALTIEHDTPAHCEKHKKLLK